MYRVSKDLRAKVLCSNPARSERLFFPPSSPKRPAPLWGQKYPFIQWVTELFLKGKAARAPASAKVRMTGVTKLLPPKRLQEEHRETYVIFHGLRKKSVIAWSLPILCFRKESLRSPYRDRISVVKSVACQYTGRNLYVRGSCDSLQKSCLM